MPRVLIRCPSSGRMIPTGMVMDRMSYDTSTLESNTVECPACGQLHRWSKSDSTLSAFG